MQKAENPTRALGAPAPRARGGNSLGTTEPCRLSTHNSLPNLGRDGVLALWNGYTYSMMPFSRKIASCSSAIRVNASSAVPVTSSGTI